MEKDDLALPLRQQVQRENRRVPVRRELLRRQVGRPAAASIARCVDDDSPDPGLERATPAVVAPSPHRARERLLHRVTAELAIACDRGGSTPELRQLRAVQSLELVAHP